MKALQKTIQEFQEYEVIGEWNWNNSIPIQDAIELLQKFEINYLKEIEYEYSRIPEKH